MKRQSSILLLALAVAGPVHAQSGSGVPWVEFGPDRANGVFLNITREHLTDQNAQGIAVDGRQRLLVLNEWNRTGSGGNLDCAVTRHLSRARVLDMDYTGPEGLEGTRRVALDMGGSNTDICSAIDADKSGRAVIVGSGSYDGGASGFVVRLGAASGAYDGSFSTDGRLALKNLAAFADTSSRLNHVYAGSDFILACGYVNRGIHRNMLVVRFTNEGLLDTGFSGDGHAEIDFNVATGTRNDACARLAVLPDGDVVLGGTVTDANGDQAYGLARLNSDGSFDNAFSGDGRLVIDDGTLLTATPALVDLAYDASHDRLLVGCNLTYGSQTSGCVIAVRDNGSLDASFDGDGRKGLRFSSYDTSHEDGDTRIKRLLPRGDGSFYVLGTHYNSVADAATWGDSDVVSLRLQADGSVLASGPDAYAGNGVAFHGFQQVGQRGVSGATDRKVADVLADATWYRGNLLLLAERPRYPAGIFDHDGDGDYSEPGPIAPVIASIKSGERLFGDDFEFDGLDAATGNTTLAVPAGFGRYCSVRAATNGAWSASALGPDDYPCALLLQGDPDFEIERAGLYSLSGQNSVLGVCYDGPILMREGNGRAPLDAAMAAASGRAGCRFTMVPAAMPLLSRPYSGAHVAGTQAFNHDPYAIALDVAEFGQTPGPYDACAIDNRGRQRSIGNPNATPSTCDNDNSGVDEPAADIPVDGSRNVVAMKSGLVVMAVPRHVPMYSRPGNDPYQREVFIRHVVGTGDYAEIFTSYYAHMRDTAVRRGDVVATGTVLGQVGETGGAWGEHLHVGVARNRNLSFRRSFEFDFSGGGAWDRDATVPAIDPWGWQAPAGIDPWAWRFRFHPSDPLRDDSGSFSTKLWLSGEEPPLP